MEHLTIVPNADGMLAEYDPAKVVELGDAKVGGLAGGMQSGKPSVVLAFDLGDGAVAVAQTSLALFLAAADGLKAAYGDPRKE